MNYFILSRKMWLFDFLYVDHSLFFYLAFYFPFNVNVDINYLFFAFSSNFFCLKQTFLFVNTTKMYINI